MNIQQVMTEQSVVNQEVFAQVKNIFDDYFEQLFSDFCYRLDVEVRTQLDKSKQSDFSQVSSYLRNQRTDLKNNYLKQVFSLFDHANWLQAKKVVNLQEVSFVKAKSVEEDYVISQIVRDCNKQYFDEIPKINHLLAKMYGVLAVKTEENPIGVPQLLNAFEEVVKDYQIKPDYRIALYKAFAVNVAQQMGFIYQDLIEKIDLSLVTKPVPAVALANAKMQAGVGKARFSADLMRLKKELSQWREAEAASVYDWVPSLSDEFYQLAELNEALHQLRLQGVPNVTDAEQKPLKWRLIELIADASDAYIYKGLPSNYEDILDFVSIVFDGIKQDEKISDLVKQIILSMEPQLAGLLLKEPRAFSLSHPVFELVNGLYEAAIFLSQFDQHDKVIIKKIAKIAVDVGDQDSCQQKAQDLRALVDKIKQRSGLVEQRTISIMENKEQLLLGRLFVAQVIDNSVANYEVPVLITDFLYNVWHNVLLLAHLKKDSTPGLWDKATKTMDLLIASSLVPMTDEKKKQVEQYWPKMVKSLQAGLGFISYDKAEAEKFFQELSGFHRELMSNPEFKPLISEKQVPVKPVESFDMTFAKNKDLPPGLALNNWLAFQTDSAIRWGKLCWKNSRSDVLVFVAKSGAKLLEIKQDDLLKRLESGSVSVLPMDARPFIEQVFAKVITHDGAV